MTNKSHPQAQLNALDLAIIEKGVALKRGLISELPQGDAVRADLLANSILVGACYQAQCIAEGAETIAAAIDRQTRAVLPRLERIETLLKPQEAANDSSAAGSWASSVGRLCAGNSRLVFAVSCAFAGPLLRYAGMGSGGFHLRGDAESGKTTVLNVAARAAGVSPSTWKATDAALEAIAARHCDSLLILDELAQVEGKVAGECVHILANGQGKTRATCRRGAVRNSWRLLFLSAGEIDLDAMQSDRVINIPGDAGAGLGAFENLHGAQDGVAFAALLAREAKACGGAVVSAFVDWVGANAIAQGKCLRASVALLSSSWLPEGASAQVEHVARRFALVGVAGMLATKAGLTGWDEGEAPSAAKACFEAWLAEAMKAV